MWLAAPGKQCGRVYLRKAQWPESDYVLLALESSRHFLHGIIKNEAFIYYYGKILPGEEVACMYLVMIFFFLQGNLYLSEFYSEA